MLYTGLFKSKGDIREFSLSILATDEDNAVSEGFRISEEMSYIFIGII